MTECKFIEKWNIIPLPSNEKIPKFEWKDYLIKKYPKEKLKLHDGNFAVICGSISDNLLVIDPDFKKKEYFSYIWTEFIKKYPELNTYIEETPRGFHVFYKTKDFTVDRKINKNLISKKIKGKEVFSGIIKTNFSKYLTGVDLLGNNGFCLIPPSKIDGKEYKPYNEESIKEITKDDYEKIRNFFVLETSKQMRKPFVDILNGKINIEEQATRTGKEEFLYWDGLFREAYYYCEIEPSELYRFLELNQPAFDMKKTEEQLKYDYHSPTNKPFTNETIKELFPKYNVPVQIKKLEPKPKEKKEFEIKTENNQELENEDLFSTKSKDSDFGSLIESIPFNECNIELRDKGVYRVTIERKKETEFFYRELILDGKLIIEKKIIDEKANNKELYSFWFKDKYYPTYDILRAIDELKPHFYRPVVGADILKRIFNYIGNRLKPIKARYILGFEKNGWNLPQLEKENDYAIVIYTDNQKNAYDKARKMIKIHSEEEKKLIRNDMKRLIETTQIDSTLLAIIIGWNISAPFRLAFIDLFDLFPHLFNVGKPNTGKGSIAKFFTIRFYGIYDSHLSPIVLESSARLEDHLSSSTFPLNIQEVHQVRNINALPILKDLATATSDYDRKKNVYSNAFVKPKIAGVSLDSNYIVEAFQDPAFNTKLIMIEHKEPIKSDKEWIKLSKKLAKQKLFSLIFDHTKDWTFKNISKRIDEISIDIDQVDSIADYSKDYPRLINSYKIIKFGMNLFEEVFDIKLKQEEVLNEMMKLRTFLSKELLDQFFQFCLKAMKFEGDINEERTTESGSLYFVKIKGSNPKFLTCKLNLNKNETYYIFTHNNLRDFNEYAKQEYSLKKLGELLEQTIEEKENLQYTKSIRYYGNIIGAIKIKKKWLNVEK